MRLAPILAILLGTLLPEHAPAADWPQFLGPARDGSTREAIPLSWPSAGPKILWSRAVGAGFSGPVVAGDRLVLHQRREDEEVLECYAASRGGEPLWRFAYPTEYRDDFGFDNGPRATPALDHGRVYAFGAEGVATCVDLERGERRWQAALGKDLRASKGFFGFACSPLVWNELVLLNVGGRDGAGIVALETDTGKVRWKATSHEASYASPVIAELAGQPRALFFTREGLAILDPHDGRVTQEFPWRSPQNASVNAAAPLVLGQRVFLTASYGIGAVLLDLGISAAEPKRVWSNDTSLSSHYASVVSFEQSIFGFHGRQEQGPSLRGIDATTGKVLWSEERLGAGTVMLARDQLLVLTEKGELLVAPADRKAFRPSARAQILGFGTRAAPALAGGRFFARDTKKLMALEFSP